MIKIKNTTLIISALLALNISHNANSEPEKSTPAPAVETAPADANPNYWGIDTKNIAKDIQPGDDFYRYVNKGWLETAKIPQGLSSPKSFTEVNLSTEKQIAVLIKEAVIKTHQRARQIYPIKSASVFGRNAGGFVRVVRLGITASGSMTNMNPLR